MSAENLLRQLVYEGLREDKDPAEVRRSVPGQPPPTALDQIAQVKPIRL